MKTMNLVMKNWSIKFSSVLQLVEDLLRKELQEEQEGTLLLRLRNPGNLWLRQMARTYGTHCIVYATCNFQKNLSPCDRNFTATSHKSSMSQTSFGNTTQRAQRVFCLKVVSLQTCFVRKTCHNLLLPHVCPSLWCNAARVIKGCLC